MLFLRVFSSMQMNKNALSISFRLGTLVISMFLTCFMLDVLNYKTKSVFILVTKHGLSLYFTVLNSLD